MCICISYRSYVPYVPIVEVVVVSVLLPFRLLVIVDVYVIVVSIVVSVLVYVSPYVFVLSFYFFCLRFVYGLLIFSLFSRDGDIGRFFPTFSHIYPLIFYWLTLEILLDIFIEKKDKGF